MKFHKLLNFSRICCPPNNSHGGNQISIAYLGENSAVFKWNNKMIEKGISTKKGGSSYDKPPVKGGQNEAL